MIEKQHDIILIENTISPLQADEIERHVTHGDFRWFYLRDVDKEEKDSNNPRVYWDKNSINTPQFGHNLFDYHNLDTKPYKGLPWQSHSWSMFELLMKSCIERAVIKDLYGIEEWSPSLLPIIEYIENGKYRKELFEIQPIRMKLNMLLNNTKVKSKEQHNIPHTDNRYENSYAGIYYVNDSDGDTIIYNEKWSIDQKERPKKLTEKMRITPKKNQFVMFDGNYYHTSTNPIESEKRIVVNMNFLNGRETYKYNVQPQA